MLPSDKDKQYFAKTNIKMTIFLSAPPYNRLHDFSKCLILCHFDFSLQIIDQGDRLIFYFERGRDSGVKATSVFRLTGARRSRARQSPKDPSTSYIQQHRSIRRHEPSDVDLLQVHASRHGLYLSVYPPDFGNRQLISDILTFAY